MMFYNGFNLMIDIILVTITALYVRRATMRDQKLVSFQELDYEYNQGWEAGYRVRSDEQDYLDKKGWQ